MLFQFEKSWINEQNEQNAKVTGNKIW